MIGFVLINNYASSDPLIIAARLAVGCAFTFFSLREGLLDLAKVTDKGKRVQSMRPITVGMMAPWPCFLETWDSWWA